jgi:hypothetical protein
MIWTLVLIYVLNGHLEVTRDSYKTEAICREEAQKKIDILNQDPHLNLGIFANCIQELGEEVNEKSHSSNSSFDVSNKLFPIV